MVSCSSNESILESCLGWKKGIAWKCFVKIGNVWHSFKRGSNWSYSLSEKEYNHISTSKSDCIQIFKYGPRNAIKNVTIIEPGEDWIKNDYVGVTKGLIKEYIEWVKQIEDWSVHSESGDWLKKLNRRSILKYNQGDAFFARAFKKNIPVTKPGQKHKTIMSKIIDNMKVETKDEKE